ncbi:MAG TPA: hypothetical protein VMB50_02655 [Myxococcales bacterium]|nr:hypothetical protein [Myxococcales bacterium]
MRSSQMLRVLAVLIVAWPVSSARAEEPDAGPSECARIDARIAKRKHFLAIRAQERVLHPSTPTFSPYCQEHPDDEDCQLLTNQQQEDLSRDVSELTMGPDGKTPVTDPVLVPLCRRRRRLHCPKPK